MSGPYSGTIYQKGYGVGSVFQGVLRAALPIAKTLGKRMVKRGIKHGIGLGMDKLKGRNMKQAAKARLFKLGQDTIKDIGRIPVSRKRAVRRAGRSRLRVPASTKRKKTRVLRKPPIRGIQRGRGDIFS